MNLGEAAPREFHIEYRDTKAYTMRDVRVVSMHESDVDRWPGPQKNVFRWWKLENGYAVGWNENPARGWSFPVVRCNSVVVPGMKFFQDVKQVVVRKHETLEDNWWCQAVAKSQRSGLWAFSAHTILKNRL